VKLAGVGYTITVLRETVVVVGAIVKVPAEGQTKVVLVITLVKVLPTGFTVAIGQVTVVAVFTTVVTPPKV
jgi:hypothetical protein